MNTEEMVIGLEQLIALYRNHPQTPRPSEIRPGTLGTSPGRLSFSCVTREELEQVVRVFGGSWTKEPRPEYGLFYLYGRWGSWRLQAFIEQGKVCVREKVGTRWVEEVPARPAHEVPVYEYRCGEILGVTEETP